jgi:hypothetical protein
MQLLVILVILVYLLDVLVLPFEICERLVLLMADEFSWGFWPVFFDACATWLLFFPLIFDVPAETALRDNISAGHLGDTGRSTKILYAAQSLSVLVVSYYHITSFGIRHR